MKFIRSSFADIYNIRSRESNSRSFSEESQASEGTMSYYDGSGFHLYAQLSLQLKYTAPENVVDATKSFEIIQRYTDIAEACSRQFTGRILEVQGERLHLFFEKELTKNTLRQMLILCMVFTNTVYDNKLSLGEDAFEGFRIVFDYGRALILSTGANADDSFVSLGPCANRPAKYLPNVAAGTTSMPIEIAKLLFDVDERRTWHTMNLKGRSSLTLSADESRNLSNFSATASQALRKVYASNAFFVRTDRMTTDSRFNFSSANLQQGFFMRADLDGFTKKVQDAFESNSEQIIHSLLLDFVNVLRYGEQFIAQTGRPVIRLPWAGDCVNILLLPRTIESIGDAQLYYSAKGQADWLSGYNGKIKPPFDGAKWLVSMCCGDASCGNRNVLIAQVETSERDFLFAVGWSVGRSLAALEIAGTRAGDAVTSKIDYDALEFEYQKYFSPVTTVFMKSGTLHRLIEDGKTYIPSLITRSRNVPGIAILTPKPRPYWCEEH